MALNIKLKWNKNEYDVEIDASESVEVFKTQVWNITNVPTDRQKYVGFPGGPLKDSDNMGDRCAKLKAGTKIMLVGTAEGGELKAPQEKVVFEEDLTAEEKAKIYKEKKVEALPPGLANLGNTCYMNATLQCLARVTGLRDKLEKFDSMPSGDRDIDSVLTAQCKGVLKQLDGHHESITPMHFLMAMRQRFPRFAEMANGAYQQQDAEECLRGLLTVLAGTLKTDGGNTIDEMFGITMETKLKCLESDEEPATESTEDSRTLMCHLGTQNEPVSHIFQGIQLSLKEHIEKNSPMLGRNAQYEKTSKLASQPSYLIVQFARFGYKQANEWAGTEAAKVKLVRKIAFQRQLDLFDLMTDDKKTELSKGRLRKKEIEDIELELAKQEKLKESGGAPASSSAAAADVEMKPAEGAPAAEGAVPMEVDSVIQMDTGYYELIAILSHKGRTADGGHYVGWALHKKNVKVDKKDKDDQWICFDDDSVSWAMWKDMVGLNCDLQGGKADTQIAYLCFYRKVTVPAAGNKAAEEPEKKAEEEPKQ